VFVANGYVWEGIFVGHVFNFWFYAYPWLLLCLVRGNALGFSLLVTFLVYGGGMHQLVIFSGVLLLLLPWLLPRLKLRTVWLSALLILLTCGGKLLLAVDYSPLFHVNPPIHKMTDPVWVQVFRFLWFDPLHTPHVGVERVGFLGPWEVIGFASRILIPLLVIGTGAIGVFLAKRRLKPVWVLGGVVCLGVFIAIATGSALNLYLPFFRTYHNPIKMLAGLIPALVVFGFWGVSRMAMPRKLGTVIVVLASVFVVGEMAFNSGFFVLFRTSIGYGWSDGPWSVVKKNRSIRVVERIGDRYYDIHSLQEGETSLLCYEPVLGYERENLKHQLAVHAPVTEVKDGAFNLTDLRCVLYLEHFGCARFSRFKETDRAAFEGFRAGQALHPDIPVSRRIAVWVSLLIWAALGMTGISRLLRGFWPSGSP
jgi:hypothetical protein